MCNLSSPNTKRVAFLYTYLVAKKHMFSRQNSYLSFACKTLKGHQRTSESQHFENCMLGSTPLPSEGPLTQSPFYSIIPPQAYVCFSKNPLPNMMPDSHLSLSLLLNDAAKMQNRNRVIRHNALGVKILRNPGHYNNTTSDACRRVFQREIRGYTYLRTICCECVSFDDPPILI